LQKKELNDFELKHGFGGFDLNTTSCLEYVTGIKGPVPIVSLNFPSLDSSLSKEYTGMKGIEMQMKQIYQKLCNV